MKVDAHYYAVLAFCRAVGFKKQAAQTVAYASQFVDDADINHITLQEVPSDFEVKTINQKPAFFNMATAHDYFKVSTLNYNAMINNTAAFHFVPGCKGANFAKKMRCKEESPVIRDILEDAKQEANLVKLGLVLHPYADTFSHQGFSGLVSKVNDIIDCRVFDTIYIGESLLEKVYYWLYPVLNMYPRLKNYVIEEIYKWVRVGYGHAQALSFPDLPYLNWEYKYDFSTQFSKKYELTKVSNPVRYKRAFQKIKQHLREYLEKWPQYEEEGFSFNDDEKLFAVLLKEGPTKKRTANWKQKIIELGLFAEKDLDVVEYDENLWLQEAFANFNEDKFAGRKVEGAKLAAEFKSSNWYKYYLGVEWYKSKFHEYVSDYFLDIPQ